jgi:hypothetical protein
VNKTVPPEKIPFLLPYWRRCASAGGNDIRLSEIVSFEPERLAVHLGEGVSKAVAEIQSGRMAALAEAVEGLAPRYACSTVKGSMTIPVLRKNISH